MWRHHNVCWKWPTFASRQDWTRRAIFCKVLASTFAVTAWISLVKFAFKASMVRGLFGKLSLSDIPIRKNEAASDRASDVAKVPSKWRGRRKKDWISAMPACDVWDVAPSCWKYPIESSSLSNWFTATSHTSHASMAEIQSFSGDRVISKGLWTHRSPDLTPPHYFLWGYLKGRVYQTNHEP